MQTQFDIARTAVVAYDFQRECIDAEGAWPIYNKRDLLANAGLALRACRAAGLPIIFTQHWLDPRGTDALRHELLRNGRPTHSVAGDSMAELHEELAPEAADIVIRKQRWTGFFGTNLDLANWLYGGAIMRAGGLARALSGRSFKAWHFEKPAAFPYAIESVRPMYDSLG